MVESRRMRREGRDDVVAVLGVEARQALLRALRHEHSGAVGLRRDWWWRLAARPLFEAGLERGRGADEQDADQRAGH